MHGITLTNEMLRWRMAKVGVGESFDVERIYVIPILHASDLLIEKLQLRLMSLAANLKINIEEEKWIVSFKQNVLLRHCSGSHDQLRVAHQPRHFIQKKSINVTQRNGQNDSF